MKKIISFLVLIISFSACSLFQETTSYDEVEANNVEKKSEEVYIFDEGTEVEIENVNTSSGATSKEEIEKVEQEVSETITEVEGKSNNNIPLAKTYPVENTSIVTEETYSEPTTTDRYSTYESYSDNKQFHLQLGAFSTMQRAERFSSNVSVNTPFTTSVIYNNATGLYVVRSSAFATRGEVEAIRDDFRRRNIYKDAFIVVE